MKRVCIKCEKEFIVINKSMDTCRPCQRKMTPAERWLSRKPPKNNGGFGKKPFIV